MVELLYESKCVKCKTHKSSKPRQYTASIVGSSSGAKVSEQLAFLDFESNSTRPSPINACTCTAAGITADSRYHREPRHDHYLSHPTNGILQRRRQLFFFFISDR